MLVMSGYPSERPALIDFAANITKNISLMVCGHVHKVFTSSSLILCRSGKYNVCYVTKVVTEGM